MRMRNILPLLPLVLLACGSDTDSEPEVEMSSPDAGEVALFDVDIDVAYNGSAEGALVVVAFANNPPAGPPLAIQTVAMPAFPVSVQLRGLEGGSYFINAMLDVPPTSPTMPGAEDLLAVSPIDVGPDGDDSMTITIEDK